MKEQNQAQARKTFSAAEIAAKLGVTDRAMRKRLADVPHSDIRTFNFKATKVWEFAALPGDVQGRLHAIALQQGYGPRGGDRYMADTQETAEPWRSPLPLSQVQERFVTKAVRLQRALLPSLKGRNNTADFSDAEFVQRGLADYAAEFGRENSISLEHWRYLLKRTLQRDRSLEQWHRVELFLDDAAFRQPRKIAVVPQFVFPEVNTIIENIKDRAQLTARDRTDVFDEAFRTVEGHATAEPAARNRIKRELLAYLFSALPGLAPSEDTLRRVFDGRYAKWIASGCRYDSQEDKRQENKGRSKPDFQDVAKIIGVRAAKMDGNVSAAQRYCLNRGEISAERALEYLQHYEINLRRDPSYVPEAIRRVATNIARKRLPFEKGPISTLRATPKGRRDWRDIQPGDVFEGDDLTLPIKWRARNENGVEIVVEGECLMIVDRKSRKILGFLLIPCKYSAYHIRLIVLHVCRKYGRPRKKLVFENGPWASRMVSGKKIREAQECAGNEWVNHFRDEFSLDVGTKPEARPRRAGGIREAVDISHAKAHSPWTKLIEGIFNVLQTPMACEPGFAGRNQRLDGYDRIAKTTAKAKRGNVTALAQLYSQEEMVRALETLCEEYNRTPQGKDTMLDGKSPDEVWNEYVSKHPLPKLPADAEYKLASHWKVRPIQKDGSIHVKTTSSGPTRVFFNETTERLPVNQKVRVYWHLEEPHLITVTDLKGRNPILVQEVVLPSTTATREQLDEVGTLKRKIVKARRIIVSDIKGGVVSTIERDSEFSVEDRALGAAMNAQLAEQKAQETSDKRARSRIDKQARERGIDPSLIRNTKSFEEGLRLEEEAEREIAKLKGIQ